jgi:hypothetical protein
MRWVAAGAFVTTAIALSVAAPPGEPHAFRLGKYRVAEGEWPGTRATRLVWLDGRGDLRLGETIQGFVRSPDGRMLVFTEAWSSRLRFVDLVRRRETWAPQLGRGPGCGAAWVLQWRRVDRVLVRWWCGDVHRTGNTGLAVLDPRERRVVSRLPGIEPWGFKRIGNRLVLLLVPSERIARAHVATVAADGSIRFARTPIRAGSRNGRMFTRSPGFAVGDGRAFVLGEGDGIASVDLDTMRVEHLRHAGDFAHRSVRFATPPEPHHCTCNPSRDLVRDAEWLGDGRLAISGHDVFTDTRMNRRLTYGLRLLDTRSWTVRVVDLAASDVTRFGEVLFATHQDAYGLIAYDSKGRKLLDRFPGRVTYVRDVEGSVADVQVSRRTRYDEKVEIEYRSIALDLSSGRVIAVTRAGRGD